jgi:hypothetical protein
MGTVFPNPSEKELAVSGRLASPRQLNYCWMRGAVRRPSFHFCFESIITNVSICKLVLFTTGNKSRRTLARLNRPDADETNNILGLNNVLRFEPV